MTCPFSMQDGAYLLGGLSPQERRIYEEHVAGCQICAAALNEVAGLPGLLSHLPAEVVEAADPPPAGLLPALLRAVAGERAHARRRWRIAIALTAAAAVVVVAVLGGTVLRADGAKPTAAAAAPTPVAMTLVGDAPLRATAATLDKPWGTEVDLRCTYTDAVAGSYSLALWAVDRAGKSEQIAAWEVLSNSEARVTGSTSVHSAELAALEVRTAKGKLVLRLTR